LVELVCRWSGSRLCRGATCRGTAGRKLTVMQSTPAGSARRRCCWRGELSWSWAITVDFRLP